MEDQIDRSKLKLRNLLLERSFKLGEFVLSSGRPSEYYVDCRTSTLHPAGAVLIVELMRPILTELRAEQVGGLTLGADPIVAAISYASGLPAGGAAIPAFIVRKEAKSHGRGKQIEGCFEAGKRTVIVEDVITTGESALKAVAASKEAGATVVGVIAVVDREEGGREAIEQEGLPVRSLFTASELKAAAKGKRE
jgi:orotate phosphoribosyltransferase